MDDDALTITICELLGRVPGWHWSETTDPPPSSLGIFYGDIPEAPDRAIGVRVYGGSDDPLVYSPQRRAQLRIRGGRDDKRGADQIASIAFSLLQGRCRSGGIAWIQRESFGPLGADKNLREERAENYSVTLDNPEVGT